MTSTRDLQPLTLSLTYNFDFTDCPLGLDYFICQISQAEPNDKPVYVYVRGTFDSDTKFLEFFGQFQLIAFGHKPVVLKALFYEQLALQTNPYLPSSSPEYNIQQNMWGDIRFGLASTRIRDKYLNTKNLLALKLSQRSQNIIVEISYKFDVTIGHPDPRAFPTLLENHATYLARICKELTPKTFGSPRHFWLNINDSLSFADAKLITHLDVDFMRMDLVDLVLTRLYFPLYTPPEFALTNSTFKPILIPLCQFHLPLCALPTSYKSISTTTRCKSSQAPAFMLKSEVYVSPWCSSIIHAVKCEHSVPNLIIGLKSHQSFAVPHSYEWAALLPSSLIASLRMAASQYLHCTAFLRMDSHTYIIADRIP
ncbi:hypothetical protein DdX_13410 [Ditylenchus destructor]|uniref:Uncharacterized protein n=1 Tax=Ditylenchus destructor TaxID=166010 RepID=A0AAD4R2U2_9BILA|nr:hypothetical protein DdX_13410 [Ditylenchus destructor]